MEKWERVVIVEKDCKIFDFKVAGLSSRVAMLPPDFDYNPISQEFIFIGYYKMQ